MGTDLFFARPKSHVNALGWKNRSVPIFGSVLFLFLYLYLCGGLVWAQPDRVPEIAIGDPAPDFSAVDQNGQQRRLSDFHGSIVVLEWTNRDCAFVKHHYNANNMQALQNDARTANVVWLTVSSSAPGSAGYMDADGAKRFLNRYQATPSAVLLDPDGHMGRQYDVELSPQVFIIDANRILIYMGSMDDQPSTRMTDIDQATDYVGEALENAVAGRPVTRPITRPYGCPIEY